MIDIGQVFGRGITFPPHLDRNRTVSWSAGAANIRESIRLILMTERGERVMLPEFGIGLKRFLFQPNTVATRRLIEEQITQSLQQWEPRIKIDAVSVEADPNDPHVAIVILRYTLIVNQANEELQLRVQLNS